MYFLENLLKGSNGNKNSKIFISMKSINTRKKESKFNWNSLYIKDLIAQGLWTLKPLRSKQRDPQFEVSSFGWP